MSFLRVMIIFIYNTLESTRFQASGSSYLVLMLEFVLIVLWGHVLSMVVWN